MEHSLKVSKTEDGKEGLLALSGELTMAQAQETKKALLDAIEAVDTLHLELREIESVDVSFVQLVCAAHRECVVTGKQFFLQGGVNSSMQEILGRAGYNRQLGCLPEAKKSCLWDETLP